MNANNKVCIRILGKVSLLIPVLNTCLLGGLVEIDTYLSSALTHSLTPLARPSWMSAVLSTSCRAVFTSIEPPVTSSLSKQNILLNMITYVKDILPESRRQDE